MKRGLCTVGIIGLLFVCFCSRAWAAMPGNSTLQVQGAASASSALAQNKWEKVDMVIQEKSWDGKVLRPDLVSKKHSKAFANELTFTFNSPYYPWSEQELATLKEWLADFYPAIEKIYGQPAFTVEINVVKDPYLSSAGAYYSFRNEIALPSLDPGTFCHEIVHAFHDDLIIGFNTYEEGMARAVEVAVMSSLTSKYEYWNVSHSYLMDVYYELANQPWIGTRNGYFFHGLNSLWRYQMAGVAWSKILIEDPAFFVKFNKAYYRKAYINPDLNYDIDALKALVRSIKPAVEHVKFDEWYSRQQIFNLSPPTGNQIIVKPDLVVYVINRVADGTEFLLADVPVIWEIFDCNGNLLSGGEEMTNPWGWINFQHSTTDYKGRIRIELRANVGGEEIFRTFLTSNVYYPEGIAGITGNDIDGVEKIGRYGATPVENGAFSEPTAQRAGKFRITNIGDAKTTRYITKDKSVYFVFVPE